MSDSDNDEFTPKDKTVGNESSNKIQTDSIFLRDNINRFDEQLFLDNVQQFSRYTSLYHFNSHLIIYFYNLL